ncbi:hypothetical protein JHK86_025092 [Glycine max]|nr:hypothetical protein JHK86_025092 [Glycine max]
MQDVEKSFKEYEKLRPVAKCANFLVTGYAAIRRNYQEVTKLWGEMKGLASSISMKFDQVTQTFEGMGPLSHIE